MQKLKGLWIPADILLNEDLSDKEKIILAMILYLSEETASCFASNKYFAKLFDFITKRTFFTIQTDCSRDSHRGRLS